MTCGSILGRGTKFVSRVKVKIPIGSKRYGGLFEKTWDIGKTTSPDMLYMSKYKKDQLHTILVVDDVSINRKVIGKFIQDCAVHVDIASTGEEAIYKCRNMTYDIILMDYFMDGKNGIETSKCIQKHGLNKETIIIIVTAAEYSEEIYNSGFGYLQKPITREMIECVVSDILFN